MFLTVPTSETHGSWTCWYELEEVEGAQDLEGGCRGKVGGGSRGKMEWVVRDFWYIFL